MARRTAPSRSRQGRRPPATMVRVTLTGAERGAPTRRHRRRERRRRGKRARRPADDAHYRESHMAHYEFEEGEPFVVIEKHSSGVSSFFWGLAAGAGLALLFAPQSG